ncbi:MAG: CHRD domain-containing protein, partial [Thermoleophilia bacterium]|nr:CHRD domain-containing protein [Thermoleophilia bacterium]
DLADLTIVRARTAPAGQTGDEVFTVYPGPTIVGPLNGSVVEGTITADDLLGPLAGQTIADLVNLIKAGEVYINVGTTANPGGELRGQL